MKQKGIVIEKNGDFATVEVGRSSACIGCAKREGCYGTRKTEKAVAYDAVGCKVGDNVILETRSSLVLLYSALVFVLPLVLCFLGYFAAGLFATDQLVRISVSACFFFATYVIIYFTFNKSDTAKKSVVITEIDNNTEGDGRCP